MDGTHSKFSIRRFEPADGPFCHAARREAFLKVFARDLDERAVEAGAEAFDPEEFGRRIGRLDSFVAVEGDTRVGFSTVRYPEEKTAEIMYVYVDLDRLGEGIGTLLVTHVEQWIRDEHPEVASIVLDTAVPGYNQTFYEKLGYSRMGTAVCRYPEGEVEAVRLIKTL
jgi:GNAT superfamily N-acetyltransferase